MIDFQIQVKDLKKRSSQNKNLKIQCISIICFDLKHLAAFFALLCFREHLGLLDSTSDEDIRDVVSDSFYEVTLAELGRLFSYFVNSYLPCGGSVPICAYDYRLHAPIAYYA